MTVGAGDGGERGAGTASRAATGGRRGRRERGGDCKQKLNAKILAKGHISTAQLNINTECANAF